MTSELEQRVVGAIVGLASSAPSGPIVAARALARSLGERGEFDSGDLLARLLERHRAGDRFGGSVTRQVLERIEQGVDAEEASRRVWEERGPEVSAGNGSVLACPPLGVALAHRPELLRELAPAFSRLTHWDGRCQTACLAVTSAAAALVRGDDRQRAVRSALELTIDDEGGEELEFLVEAVGGSRRVDGPDRSFCLFAAAVALQTVVSVESFDDGLRHVVSLGGDTDANAAIAGALLGARFGREAIPVARFKGIEDLAELESEARALLLLAAAR